MHSQIPATPLFPDVPAPSGPGGIRAGLSLAPGLHMCECDGICIFLDIPGDRYFCLSPEQSASFRTITCADPADRLPERLLAFRQSLIRRGVLVESPSAPGFLPPAQTARAPCLLRDLPASGSPPISSALTARVAHAAFTSWWLERRHRFEGVIRHIAQLKQDRLPGARNTAPSWETLVATFHEISPWLFTREDACRFRSIVLIRFLAGFGVGADWVFGVRLAPFGAHCWVEKDGAVLNDLAARVREFTPILRV